MRVGSALAVYLLFWMLTLFAVLPWGVRTSDEAGTDRAPGEADSAPVNPMLWRKVVWTTAIATPLFALFYANYVVGWVTMDSF